jgi:Hemerythrin HHE cation binding domain
MGSRHDMYRNVHKGLRRELCSLLADAGAADSTAAEQAQIAARWQATSSMLASHHQHEDHFIGPHIARLAPSLFAEMERDHESLDAEAKALDLYAVELTLCLPTALAECSLRFYRLLAGFIGRYLHHMANEEGPYLRALQAAYTDAELAGIEGALVASIAPEKMATFCLAMLPAMNLSERVEMLADMRAHAPEPAFVGMCELAKSALDSASWAKLSARLFAEQTFAAHA